MTHPFDAWCEEYKPIQDGYQFDNYGDDFAFVQAQPNENVWTFSDESGAGTFLSAGLTYCNSLGYYVTEKPWTNEHQSITLRECK